MKKLVKFFTLFLSLTVLVCLAGCKKPAQYTAQQMADAIQFANDKKEVTFQFAVDKQVERLYEGSETEKQVAPITWTSDDKRVTIKDYIVELNYDANNEAPAKIKGEVEVNGEKASQEFQIRILKENTYEEFMNMEKGKAVSVSGYVSYLGEYSASYKNFTMQVVAKDKQHSYYAYRASCDAATYKQLSVGQLVGLTGEADEYNGKQLAKAKVSVLSGDKFIESAVELPEADLKKSENLNKLVKVTAEVTGAPVDDNGSYRVEAKVGNTEVQIQNNKYFYESGSAAGEAVKNKILGLKPADTVVLEGYLGSFKETPTFTVVKPDTMQVTAGDPDKAAVGIAKGNVEKALKDADLTKAGEITFTLPEGVTAEITLDNNDQQVIKVVDGKLVLAPTATETKVNVTIKLTKDSQTAEVKKELVVKLPGTKFDEYINASANTELENITGVVTSAHSKADKKGTIYAYILIQDANGAYYLRQKVNSEAEMNQKFEVGYSITISKAKKGLFKDLHQLSIANLDVVTKGEKAEMPTAKVLTEEIIKDENKMLLLQSSYVTVTGVVEAGGKSIKVGNTKFSYFADDKICGTKPEALVEGKTVTITGFIGYDNGYQINPASSDSVVVK